MEHIRAGKLSPSRTLKDPFQDLLSREGGFVTGFHIGGFFVLVGVLVVTGTPGDEVVGGGVSLGTPVVVVGRNAASSALMS